MFTIKSYKETWPIDGIFKIAHGERSEAEVVICEIHKDGITGYGEAYPYARFQETPELVLEQIKSIYPRIYRGITREKLQDLMPAGSARCAIDLALWDLESKQKGVAIWELAGLPKPGPIDTAFTISINSLDKVAQDVRKNKDKRIIKLKLGGDHLDAERIKTVRANAPNAKIVIDANESWTPETYKAFIGTCLECNVAMIEQPFKASIDSVLKDLEKPIPICADESCHHTGDLNNLVGKYDMINIKLDKTGGLTEAINLYHKARELGFKIMIGCMVTTSLAIKPAYYLAQLADFSDIDGFVLLAKDREDGLKFKDSQVFE